MAEQGKLFDDDRQKRYEVFKLTPAQRRNGKRGVARCRKILEEIRNKQQKKED